MSRITGVDCRLSEALIKKAKPKDKAYKLTDGKGLYLLIEPNGKKYWRFKYAFGGKEKMISMGVWPESSVEEARGRKDKARALLRDGVNPSEERQNTKIHHLATHKNSFETIAREWHQMRKETLSPRHAHYTIKRLEADIFPTLGHRPIVKITVEELLKTLRRVEERGVVDISHRILQSCSQVFFYAIASGRAERNIALDIKGALKVAPPQQHHNCLEEKDLPEFFTKLEAYHKDNKGEIRTQLALQLIVLTFVRTSELRQATWDEISFEEAEWRIPAERMKMSRPHIVPLSYQTLALFRELEAIRGSLKFIFPSERKPYQPISNNTVLGALYRMGYHGRATGHGFRATASTILNEMGFREDLVEIQLAHVEKNKVRRAYNGAQYLPERRRMMQWWADYLDAAKQRVSVADFRKQIFPDIDVKNEQLFCRHG